MKPKISVIVPCYNCEKSIIQALDSLRFQTLNDIEVIAINDGSTDRTLDLLNQYKKEHSTFNLQIYSQENQGISAVRNLGISKVEGKYFGFLDSDDYAENTMYESLYDLCEKENLQIGVSNFYWEYPTQQKLQKEGPYSCGEDMVVNLFAVLWNKIYLTEFIRSLDISFPNGYRYEDACFLYRLAPHVTKIDFVDEAFVHYVQHGQSITHTNNKDVQDMVNIFQIITTYYKENDLYQEYYDSLEYIHIRFFLGNSFLRSAKIDDPKLRKETILLGWNLLNNEFPNWRKNKYLSSIKTLKNTYFKMVRKHNLMFFAWLFRNFKKDNV